MPNTIRRNSWTELIFTKYMQKSSMEACSLTLRQAMSINYLREIYIKMAQLFSSEVKQYSFKIITIMPNIVALKVKDSWVESFWMGDFDEIGIALIAT